MRKILRMYVVSIKPQYNFQYILVILHKQYIKRNTCDNKQRETIKTS
jgi:hypothetical protein